MDCVPDPKCLVHLPIKLVDRSLLLKKTDQADAGKMILKFYGPPLIMSQTRNVWKFAFILLIVPRY